MQRKEPELSPLARQLLGSSGAMKLFTQTEFDDALTVAKAEIMAIAIETTRKAISIEREECAKVALQGTDEPVQTDTLEILKKERQRISDAIKNMMKKND